jgi:hypothetical protein
LNCFAFGCLLNDYGEAEGKIVIDQNFHYAPSQKSNELDCFDVDALWH